MTRRAADQSVASHVDPTDQAIGALAMVEPRTGDVKALAQSRPMGTDKARGQTYLNYVVPQELGHSNGFQAGSTFKAFVLAAAIKQGIPLSTQINAPPAVSLVMNTFPDCDGNYPSTQVWNPHNSTDSGTFNLYTGTQLSVNTFFAQLEQRTGLCEPVPAGQGDGHRARRPGPRAGPVLHPRRAEHQPAGDGRGLRHLRRPRPALRRPPGVRGRGRQRQHARRSTPRSASRCCPARSPTPSTTS